MEAVGSASSLLAVITAAIQSTKIVYDAVSAVRNGPAAAQRLAKTINDLLQLLSLFERFGPRLEAISEQNGRDTAEYLRKKLLECERRMNEIQVMLVTFQVRPECKFGDKLKRSGRLNLQEKD
ncbi:hypothetical protein LTR10_022970 [Elasticomyces elasticus]|nr:hypothetical protein LTR10_022970 [Elasticomyces elasticus]